MDCHYPYSYVFIPHPGQSSSGKTWHTSPKSMVPDILTTVKWWDLVGLPTLKPRISYWLWQIRMIFPWHGTPNKIHTINPSFVGATILGFIPFVSSFYTHSTPTSTWYPQGLSGNLVPQFFFMVNHCELPVMPFLGPLGPPKGVRVHPHVSSTPTWLENRPGL